MDMWLHKHFSVVLNCQVPVSYTHLDVYKRQVQGHIVLVLLFFYIAYHNTSPSYVLLIIWTQNTQVIIEVVNVVDYNNPQLNTWHILLIHCLVTVSKRPFHINWTISKTKRKSHQSTLHFLDNSVQSAIPVSYTHLDVYKRQAAHCMFQNYNYALMLSNKAC